MIKSSLHHHNTAFQIHLNSNNNENFSARINEEDLELTLREIDAHTLSILHESNLYKAYVAADATHVYVLINGEHYVFEKAREKKSAFRPGMESAGDSGNDISAPMPGKILKIFVKTGQKIDKNDRLFIVEAMKMENEVKSSRAGKIKKINFKENDLVSVGEAVIELES